MLDELNSMVVRLDLTQVIIIFFIIIFLIIAGSQTTTAIQNLWQNVINRRYNKINTKVSDVDDALRNELKTHIELSEQMLANDKRMLDRHDKEIQDLKDWREEISARIEYHDELAVLNITSVKVLLRKQLGLVDDGSIIEAVDEIDEFLVSRKRKEK